MERVMLEALVTLAQRVGFLFLATADRQGRPHLASARRAELISGGRLAVTEWFCPGTVANLRENPRLSVVAWDSGSDVGYQVIGEAEALHDVAMLDGFAAGLDEDHPLPQVERRLVVEVREILEFRQQPHSDEPAG